MLTEGLVELNSQNACRSYLPWVSLSLLDLLLWTKLHVPSSQPCTILPARLDGTWCRPCRTSGSVPTWAMEVESVLPYIFMGGGLGTKRKQRLGSRPSLVLGDKAAVGNSWRADLCGSEQRDQLQAGNGRVVENLCIILCRCATVRRLKLLVKPSVPRSAYSSLSTLHSTKISFDSSQLALKRASCSTSSCPYPIQMCNRFGQQRHEFSPV